MRLDIHFLQFLQSKKSLFLKGTNKIYLLFILSILILIFCSGDLFFHLVVLPARADAGMAAARSLYRGPASPLPTSILPPKTPAESNSSSSDITEVPSFSQLRTLNPDVTGWITITGTVIDYPVLLAPKGSPDYYLSHDWERNTTKYGSIFMFPSATKATEEKNTILYGHSMKDGRMFSILLQYDNIDFYRIHPLIQFQEGDEKADWKIFAVIKVNTDPSQGQPFNYQKRSFASANDFLNYLYEVRMRSIFNLPVDLKSSDDILTLSTCSYEFDGFRTVVLARRVRKDEDSSVDISKAGKNSQVLYPDCWYKKFGGTKPSLPDFQSARKNKELSWLEEA